MAAKVNCILHGDCINELRKLDEGCVDLAFADPPFNIGYDYDEYDDKRSSVDYLDWSRRWISEVVRVLKPDGTFWLAIGDEYAAELKVLCTRALGLTCRNWVVWYYTFGVHCKAKFTRSHAHLFYFVKNEKRFTFNVDAVRVPSARQLVYADKRANPKGRVPDDTWIIRPEDGNGETAKHRNNQTATRRNGQTAKHRKSGISNPSRARKEAAAATIGPPDILSFVLRPQDVPESFAADGDTWYFPRVCGTFKERTGFHGCQMPEQLLGRIIKACSNEKDLVLDPFSGSGTTLVVAKKLNRRYVGIELSKTYVTETRARLKRTRPNEPLTGPENPLTSVANTANGKVRSVTGKRVARRIATQIGEKTLWD